MNYQPVSHLLCQETKDGIRVLRAFGNQSNLSIPDTIGDKRVTEIGPYCFSASEKPLPEDTFLWSDPGAPRRDQLPPPLQGEDLESVRLSSRIATLHNGAFYNCRQLIRLSFGPAIRGIGSDVFTNCRQLRHLEIRSDDRQSTGLPLLLERLPEDLTVTFPGGSMLFFPEYYEWLDEVTPAHLFSRTINGEGYRMRKCFRDGVLDFDKYDQCFSSALVTESDESLCRIALSRLLYPAALSPTAKTRYQAAIKERAGLSLSMAIEARNPSLLSYICRETTPGSSLLSSAYTLASRDHWSEGCAILTEEISRAHHKPVFDFDMDF